MEDRLASAEKDWLADYSAQGARAQTLGDTLGLARAVRRIRRIKADYPPLRELARKLKKLSKGGGLSFYNRNYLRQLYDTAAADYALGDYPSAARHLSVLLNENPLHEAGNTLVDRLRDEGRIGDAQEP